MDSGLVTSLSGALAQSRRIETIANNIANAETVGFKERDLVFEEALESAHQKDTRSDVDPGPLSKSELLARPMRENRPVLYGADFTNMKEGGMRSTGNSFDLAIEGNGFFEVLSPKGIRLTRAGNLSLDAQGQLVTRDGFLVLGPKAAGITVSTDPAQQNGGSASSRAIRVGNGNFEVDVEGNISRITAGARENVGKLSVVQVENPKALKLVGQNMFEAAPEAFVKTPDAPDMRAPASVDAATSPLPEPKENPLGPTNVAPRVHQGMLEGSNVNPVEQMTRMIQAQRLYDQNLKIMQSQGDMTSRLSDLGKF
ncbi:MAG: flagellar basal-body rod protein FlgF [Bdellovibrionota bacterium]